MIKKEKGTFSRSKAAEEFWCFEAIE